MERSKRSIKLADYLSRLLLRSVRRKYLIMPQSLSGVRSLSAFPDPHDS